MIVPSELTSELLADEPTRSSRTPASVEESGDASGAVHVASTSGARKRKRRSREEPVAPAIRRGHQLQASGRVVRRMTVNVEQSLGDELAEFCAHTRRTQSDVISEGLRMVLKRG